MTHPTVFTVPQLDWDTLTQETSDLFEILFPICRSITGNGVRQTLRHLKNTTDFEIKEIPSGTRCYDWTVPDEWNITDAYVKDEAGSRVIDFQKSNIHIVNYSVPVETTLTFQELDKHLYTLPAMPEAIPYRTTYYNRNWGFCLSHNDYLKLDREGVYHVKIDSTLAPGNLTYGEAILPGTSGQEYLVSTYVCHPSLANDNLSGPILWSLLLRTLREQGTRHSYRFIIIAETIGAIAYLHQNETNMLRLSGGFIPTTVAGPGSFGYKRTFLGNHLVDRVVERTFSELNIPFNDYPFHVNGSDEAHFSAPYFRIPVGTIAKDKYYEYPYYHTSLDDLNFVQPAGLVDTLKLYLSSIEKLELNLVYRSLNPHSEPMLGKRGLYPQIGGYIQQPAMSFDKGHLLRGYTISLDEGIIYGNELDAIRWVMFYSDGENTLLDIAEKTNLPVRQLYDTAEKLRSHHLLKLTA